MPPSGGRPEPHGIETTERALHWFIDKVSCPNVRTVQYEGGPGGAEAYWLLSRLPVACEVSALSLIPVRAGEKGKTDPRDEKLGHPRRAENLRLVESLTRETDLLTARSSFAGGLAGRLQPELTQTAASATSELAASTRVTKVARILRPPIADDEDELVSSFEEQRLTLEISDAQTEATPTT